MKNITIKDIARIAGVSQKTVSRVINNEKHVKKDTIKKVSAIVNQYGYEPNFFARSLKTRKSKTIGLIIGDIENPYYARLSKGVMDVAEYADYNVMVCNSKYTVELGERYLNMLIKKGVDGVLIATIDFTGESIKKLRNRNIPFVLITCKLDTPPDVNYVISDDYYGGRIAAEYLINLGHRKIYFLRAADVVGANERVRAFRDVLMKNKCFSDDCISKALVNSDGSYEETRRFLKTHYDYTAIMGGNDFVAMGAMEAILESGLKIPEDISLMGYDNLKITSILKIPLTTVEQPNYEFGDIAARRLIQMIEDHESMKKPQKIVKKPKLIIRESCRMIVDR
ncbi:MAG: LacI family DNA-binding transcriptional regulator [Spirochaetota bacterium]|uniref:LacI family DNA-binding transcriptional regulator n=1 Tax=Candidatus Jordarchaeum sp. TaxID=2823881 RepID=UPI00404B297D